MNSPSQFEIDTENFFLKYNGKFLDFDHAYGNQCTDVFKAYCAEVLKISPPTGNAIDLWRPLQGFTQIPKEQGPKFGDVVIFDFKPVGHVAVVNNYSQPVLGCFGQNDPLGSPSHYKDYDYSHVVGYQRLQVKPSSGQVSDSPTFTLHYTAINTDPNLLEQARQLLLKYSNGRIDCNFQYQQLPPIISPTLWTSDEQDLFLKNFPVSTPFCYLTYTGNDPNHSDARTSTSPNSKVIVTASYNVTDPMAVSFEIMHGLQEYILDKGFPIGLPLDNYNATPELVQAKVDLCIPFLDKIV